MFRSAQHDIADSHCQLIHVTEVRTAFVILNGVKDLLNGGDIKNPVKDVSLRST